MGSPLSLTSLRDLLGVGPARTDVPARRNKLLVNESATGRLFVEAQGRGDLLTFILEALKFGGVLRRCTSGIVIIRAQQFRTQDANRDDALLRLTQLVQSVLVVARYRVATKPTRGSQRRRLDSKTKRGEIKAGRRTVED